MAQLISALRGSFKCVSVGSNPIQGIYFEFINQFTIIKFQLRAVEYTGLKFTKGVFDPKPKALEKRVWTPKLYLQILSILKSSQFMSY